MNDTLKEAEEFQNNLYKKFTGEEKLLMASNIFDAAREIVISSLPEGLSNKEIISYLFLRFYKDDFTETQREAILNEINNKIES